MVKQVFNYFLKVVGAAYLGLVMMLVVTVPIRLITESYNVEYAVSSLACVIVSMIALLIMCIKDGYDEKTNVKIGTAILYMSLAVALYVIITIIFRYYTGAASNVVYVAKLLGGLDDMVDLKELVTNYKGLMFISLVVQAIPLIPAMIFGYIIGKKKREQSRKSLIRE